MRCAARASRAPSVERYDPFGGADAPTKALWAAERPGITSSAPARG